MKTKQNYQKLFNPSSVAIVGASDKEGKVGTVIAKNILELGFGGKVFLVNQSYEKLYDQKCYSSLTDIKEPVDLAVVIVPAKFVAEVIAGSAGKIKNFVVISAGFGEIGQEGIARERELQKLSEENDLNILGPNCLGFIVPNLKLNASFAGGMPEKGNIAFVSQSGALAVALMDIARQENLAFSSIISVGNKMEIDESHLLEFFEQDKNTKVIAMYLEGVKDGERFVEVASRVSKTKPIVVLKAGKSAKSQQAISSHTGALAGSDAIADIAFEKAGILRAQDLEHFFDLVSLMSSFDAPKNNQVGMITNAGGAGVLATDAFEGKELMLCEFSEKEKKELKEKLPEEASVNNPVDVLGDAHEDRYKIILDDFEKNKNVGSVIVILTPQDQTPVGKIAQEIISARKKSKKIIIASFVGGERVFEAVEMLGENGVPNFSSPERAVRALDSYCKWNKIREKKNIPSSNLKINSKRALAAAEIINHAKTQGRKALYYAEAAEIMELYGVPVAKVQTILPKQGVPKDVSYPVVLKIDSDKVLHKSDKQALIAGIENGKQLQEALKQLRKNFPLERFIIQPQQNKQMEVILGIKKDENFGPVIVYGLGGIYTEIFKKINFLIPPMDSKMIAQSLEAGALGFLFKETRGQKPYDTSEFAKIITGLIEFSAEVPQIREFDINPLFIYNDGRKASAVDVKIIF